MANLRLTLAIGDYDHARDLALERVRAPGIDLTVLNYNVEEIFFRFFERAEWDVSELSMGMYTSALSRGDDRFIAIPVFPSRVFRHSAIYVASTGGIDRVQDLIGKRVGCPQWSQTATIYVRGYLAETAAVPLSLIHWVQAGVNEAGRPEPAVLKLPADITIRTEPHKTLNAMLLAGEIDALISARPPKAYLDGDPHIRRLFEDYRLVEEEYFRSTGIFPIMHTVAIRRDVYEANRWITAAHAPVPWLAEHAERAGRVVFQTGGYWPYGVDANRSTLEAFLRFAHDQGTCHRKLHIEELFAPEALAEIRV
jgi:4,5-dihydroxyphthalate decarboxylase